MRFKTTIGMLLSAVTLSLVGCSGSTVKDGINKAGDVAGQAAGEFVEGTAHGLEKSFELAPTLSPELMQKGLALGSYDVASDSAGNDNILTLYVIFNEAFTGPLTCKIYDHKQLEMGRARVEAAGAKGEAKYVEFAFDPRANIDSDTKVTVE